MERASMAVVVALTVLVCVDAASGLTGSARVGHAPGVRGFDPALRPPTTLPDASGSRTMGTGEWIVAADTGTPTGPATRLARGLRMRPVAGGLNLFVGSEPAAARLVDALRRRGWFAYAEPDVATTRAAAENEPLATGAWWRPMVVAPGLVPPPATAPVLGISESAVDLTHPELAAGNVTTIGTPVGDAGHGTSVTSVAVAPENGVGFAGVWPGAPTRVYLNGETCSSTVNAIATAAAEHIPVYNMSYGFAAGECFSHFKATQFAFGNGTVLVAAAGNEFADGNPRERPANDPHVLTVASIDRSLASSDFSNANTGIDVAAPGADVLAAVPVALDIDGTPDGFATVSGTSFSSPMAAAATAWVRAARPTLTASQATQLMRLSARDLGRPGWDRLFGFGLVDIATALTRSAPIDDPMEPNDDIEWIDGRHFQRDPAALFRRRSLTIVERLDVEEDPIDVIAAWVPHGQRLRVTVRPLSTGNVNVEIFDRRAKTVYYRRTPKTLITGSYRKGNRREDVFIDNTGASQLVYVETYVPTDARFLDASYRLTLSRGALPRR